MKHSSIAGVAGLTILLFAPGAASPALAVEGAWVNGQRAAIRLVAAGIGADGRLAAGIEIVMPPGWHTYWRAPGDAGIAPSFDASESANLGPIEVSFPVPTRLDDGFSVTNVYYDRVLLPVSATVIDPARPADLNVTIDLGVCEEVCVPESLTASLSIPAGDEDATATTLLAGALALVPAAPEPGFAVESVARDGGTDKRPVFRFRAVVPDAGSSDLFVEGPEDWSAYLPAPAGNAGEAVEWTVKFSRLGAKIAAEDAVFRVTLISGGRAIEQTIAPNRPLDEAAPVD